MSVIRLNLPRDEYGRFVLTKGSLAEFDAVDFFQKSSNESPRFLSWIGDKTGRKVLVKFREEDFVPLYKSDIFSEMIFEAFAKASGFSCANVDVGSVNGADVILSEHVSPEGFVFSYKEMNAQTNSEIEPKYYTLDGVINNVKLFAKVYGLEVDKNLRLDLLKLMLVDFLTFQQDRHDHNLLFFVQDRKIGLAPAIDNEKSFLIDRIAVFLSSLDFIDNTVYKLSLLPSGANNKAVLRCFDDVRNSTKIFSAPILVPRLHSFDEVAENAVDEEPYDEYNEYRSNNNLLSLYAEDFAFEMKNNEKLYNFYKGMNFDIFDLVKRGERASGYKIPEIYASFAEDIIKKQKRRIDRALENEEEKEEK